MAFRSVVSSHLLDSVAAAGLVVSTASNACHGKWWLPCTVWHFTALDSTAPLDWPAAMADSAAPLPALSAEQLRRRAKTERQRRQRAELHAALAARVTADRLAPDADAGTMAIAVRAEADGAAPPGAAASTSGSSGSRAARTLAAASGSGSRAAAAESGTMAIAVSAEANASQEALPLDRAYARAVLAAPLPGSEAAGPRLGASVVRPPAASPRTAPAAVHGSVAVALLARASAPVVAGLAASLPTAARSSRDPWVVPEEALARGPVQLAQEAPAVGAAVGSGRPPLPAVAGPASSS